MYSYSISIFLLFVVIKVLLVLSSEAGNEKDFHAQLGLQCCQSLVFFLYCVFQTTQLKINAQTTQLAEPNQQGINSHIVRPAKKGMPLTSCHYVKQDSTNHQE